MNMYSLLETKPHATEEEVENHFDGNICRCTGCRELQYKCQRFRNFLLKMQR